MILAEICDLTDSIRMKQKSMKGLPAAARGSGEYGNAYIFLRNRRPGDGFGLGMLENYRVSN